MAAGENIDFTLAKHDERDRTALEAPTHRDRDGHISLREANSSRAVSLPMNVDPPPAHSLLYVLWQVSRLVQLTRTTSWGRYDRQDGYQRPGAAAPSWRRSLAGLSAAPSPRCWSPSRPRPPSSSRSALVWAVAWQKPPVRPLPVCRRLLRDLLGQDREDAARTVRFRF